MMTLRIPAAFLAALLAGCLSGCGGVSGPEADLRDRAQGFGDLLVELRDLSQDTGTQRVERYLVPSTEREDQAAKYIHEFSRSSGKLRIIGHSIEEVELDGSEIAATVTYRTAVRIAGTERSALQLTRWLLVDGTWYRTLEDAEKS